MATRILTDPIYVVPSGAYRAKFVMVWMTCSSRANRASEIRYDLEITSPMRDGRRYRVSDGWLVINTREHRLYDQLVKIFDDEIDGLLDEDGTVDMEMLIGKEVEVTVGNYVNTGGSVGPRHWFQVSYVESIRRAEPLKPGRMARKKSSATRSKVSRKPEPVAIHNDAFAQIYPDIAAV